jgi:CheY-like chemotaxis protein
MEAIGTLAGGISHNFNNLLMGIQGNVSLVRRGLDQLDPNQARLATIEDLVQDGSRLTRQLLGYARAGRYEIRVIDLNSLVGRTAETFSSARKEIRLHIDLAPDLPPVLADQGQLEQVLLNLFVNGAEAMPRGGDIHVSTELAKQAPSQSGLQQPSSGPYIRLSVRDSGVGMSAETVQRIFDPFFTTKGMSGGTGLGLASVYGTINAHGGYIEVSSEEGAGSTFSVFLPSTLESVDDVETHEEEVVLGKGTVLVVDDDQAVLEACGSILSHLEYHPICVATGGDAIEIYRKRFSEIDMVILDMILPDVGGGEVFDAIRAIDRDAPVLLSSGYSLDGQAEAILERGCNDFIQKPFTVEQLSQKMSAVLGRS